jgi:threonine/homoserine/homoserine lactone efflux protein
MKPITLDSPTSDKLMWLGLIVDLLNSAAALNLLGASPQLVRDYTVHACGLALSLGMTWLELDDLLDNSDMVDPCTSQDLIAGLFPE